MWMLCRHQVEVIHMNHNEKERLAKLAEFRITASGAEERFDRLARLARHVVDSPISWICFHDATTLWVKAQEGGHLPLSMPRENSICQRVVDGGVPCQILDLAARESDPVAQYAHREFGARSYIGVPICADGVAIGAVAAIDFEPKFVAAPRQHMLADVAALVVTELRLRLVEMGNGQFAGPAPKKGAVEGLNASFKSFTKEHLRVLQAISDAVLAINRSGGRSPSSIRLPSACSDGLQPVWSGLRWTVSARRPRR